MRLAVQVEKELTKEQILERYLNVAYFGHRAYGIYAAAEVYFSKSPKDLTLAEAAMLAGLVKAPTAYDPATGPAGRAGPAQLRDRPDDPDPVHLAGAWPTRPKKVPIQLHLTDPPNDCISVNPAHNDWGFFCDMFKNWWRNQPAFGKTPQEREENLRRGGYTIVTSLDPRMQERRHGPGDQPGAHRQLVRARPGRGRARHRQDQGGRGQPQLQPGPDPQRHGGRLLRAATRPPAATRTRSRRCSAAATCPATRPARRSRSSR